LSITYLLITEIICEDKLENKISMVKTSIVLKQIKNIKKWEGRIFVTS